MHRFTITLTIARVVRYIVARTNAPVDAIINNEDVADSAKATAMTLPAQTRPVKRIVLMDGLNFLRRLKSRAKGVT